MAKIGWNLIATSKEIAGKFQPELLERLRRELEPRELRLLDAVLKFYRGRKARIRYYDVYHILECGLFSVKAVRAGQAPPLTIPAALLHDTGYTLIDPLLKDAGEDKERSQVYFQSRILHMQEGSSAAAELLTENGGYAADEVGAIVGSVASHDNRWLGLPLGGTLRLSLRDADRTFVMHLISFYKDWLSIGSISLLELFRSRIAIFYDSADPPPRVWGEAEKVLEEDRHQYQEAPCTELAKLWRNAQFAARWQEIQENIIRDEKTFRKYAESHIRAELKAGRA